MLDHITRIKSGGYLGGFLFRMKDLEMVLRVFRTCIKYHHLLLPDSFVKLTKKAKWTVRMLQQVFDEIPDECKTNINLESLESHLLEFFEGNTKSSYSYELNDFDLSKYMDCLRKILYDVRMMCLEWARPLISQVKIPRHRLIKKLIIVEKKINILKYLYATEINGNVNHEKLECLENRIQFMANNVEQLCIALVDYIEAENENDIFHKPPYLLSLIVFVELEMKKIIFGELKTSKYTQSKTFKDKKLPKGFSHHLHSIGVHTHLNCQEEEGKFYLATSWSKANCSNLHTICILQIAKAGCHSPLL